MLLFGWNHKPEKSITLHLQPLYSIRLDNSLYHIPDTVAFLLQEFSVGFIYIFFNLVFIFS